MVLNMSLSGTTPNEPKSAIRVWWWTSVPYLFVYSVLVILFRPTPGILAHILFPFLIAFWLTLYSSVGWFVVMVVRTAVARRIAPANPAMLVTSLVASVIGLYLEFFWTANMG